MKIQCACGAKYSFDATPEMLQNPVRLVCPRLRSGFVGFRQRIDPAGICRTGARRAATGAGRFSAPENFPRRAACRQRRSKQPPGSPAEEHCAKHPRELAASHCVVCGKPMCGHCMKLFGHVCSPLCRAKAEAQNIDGARLRGPIVRGRRAILAQDRRHRRCDCRGSRFWRSGFWIWYALDRLAAARGVFPPVSTTALTPGNPVFAARTRLSSSTAARWRAATSNRERKSGPRNWSRNNKSRTWSRAKMNRGRPTNSGKEFPKARLRRRSPGVCRANCSCTYPARTFGSARRRSSRATIGTPARCCRKFPLAGRTEFIARNDEFLLLGEGANGQALVTHINPATGESRVEEIGPPGQALVAAAAPAGNAGGAAAGGLPLTPGAGTGGAMNPAKVGEQAQNLSLPGRLALPAVLANESEQEQIAAELKADEQTPASARPPAKPPAPAQNATGQFTLIPGPDGYVEFAARLLESHIVTARRDEGARQKRPRSTATLAPPTKPPPSMKP